MIDYSRLTPEQVNQFIHIQSIIGRQEDAARKVRDLRAYYDGDHPVLLTRRQQEYLGPLLTESEFVFAHNLVKVIVDTLRERLSVTSFAVNGAGMDDDESGLVELCWQWWTANRMDSQQNRLYKRTLRDGKSYVMVDYDGAQGRPRFTLHGVDDGTVGVTYHRDPSDPNAILFANRYFYTFDPLRPGETGKLRKTTYLPHEIRKYVQSAMAGGWMEVMDDGDTAWPLPWTDRTGAPLGIAIIEFENPDGSEIAQAIGLQNALNKTWLDLLAAADASGFPLMAAEYNDAMADITSDDDDLEGADEFRIAPGRVIEIFGGRMNRIESGDLSQLINTIWTITAALSGTSRTPQHYLRPLGGDVPSGESLKQLESGLVKRAEERQLMFGQGWEDVMALALRVEDTFGQRLNIPRPLTITTHWADADITNPLIAAQTAQLHAGLNVPDNAVWGLLGYSPEEIQGFEEASAARRAQEVATIAASIRLNESRNIPQTGAAQ